MSAGYAAELESIFKSKPTVFDRIIPNAPSRADPPIKFNKTIYNERLNIIKQKYDIYKSSGFLFDLQNIIKMIKYTIEDMKADQSDFTPEEVIINERKLIDFAEALEDI